MPQVSYTDVLQSAFFAALAAAISTFLSQSDHKALAAVVATAPVRDFLTVYMSQKQKAGDGPKLDTMREQAADMVRGDIAVLMGTVILWTIIYGSDAGDVHNIGTHAFIPATVGWLASAFVLVMATRH